MKQAHSISWTTKQRTLDEREWKWTVAVYNTNTITHHLIRSSTLTFQLTIGFVPIFGAWEYDSIEIVIVVVFGVFIMINILISVWLFDL